jgi:hypothetical protein
VIPWLIGPFFLCENAKQTNLIYYIIFKSPFLKYQLVISWKSQLFWTRLNTFNSYKCLFGPRVKGINAFWNEVSLQTGKYVFNSRRLLLLWIAYFLNYSWMRRVRCANARWELSQMRRLWLPLVRSQMRQLFWDNAICLLCCWFNEAPRSASALSNWTLEAGTRARRIRRPAASNHSDFASQQNSVILLSGGVNNSAVKAQH